MAGKLKYDLTGQKFGRWTVIERTENTKGKDTAWLCKCECGTIRTVLGKNLRNGRSASCGCYKKEFNRECFINLNKSRALDLRGHKYGLLTPIELAPQEMQEKRKGPSLLWKCQCDCGNITYVTVDNLKGQHPVLSCGCLKTSFGEHIIAQLLKENSISFINEYHPTDGYGRYDFALLDENNYIYRLIEFDGKQHFEEASPIWEKSCSFEERQQRDKIKNEYALSHNIPLVRIPYWERNNITLEMIMGDQYLVKDA